MKIFAKLTFPPALFRKISSFVFLKYLIKTLEIVKAISTVCDVKNSNKAFRRQVAN